MTLHAESDSAVGAHTGVLFFPVTPFAPDGSFDPAVYAAHLNEGLRHEPGGVFACCGTGEYFSLDIDEYAEALRTASATVAGRAPLFAGVGGGTRMAREYAQVAEAAGVDGILVLPPYLVVGSQEGLARHYESVADSVSVDVIVYQRDNAVFEPATVRRLAAHPRIRGLKDGHGDFALLREIISEVDDPAFEYFNGMPTAEVFAQQFLDIGVSAYSSAIFCFVPEVAVRYERALREGQETLLARVDTEFFAPLIALRDESRGFAVSLVKAGVRLRGYAVGPVRPPLHDLDPAQERRLGEIIAAGLRAVGEA